MATFATYLLGSAMSVITPVLFMHLLGSAMSAVTLVLFMLVFVLTMGSVVNVIRKDFFHLQHTISIK